MTTADILIIGGSGFVGSKFVEVTLKAGLNIYLFTRPEPLLGSERTIYANRQKLREQVRAVPGSGALSMRRLRCNPPSTDRPMLCLLLL